MGDWLFIADAHLREGDLEQQQRIIRFLESETGDLETLVILGDLFEFWFGFEPFAFEGYRPLLAKLEELVQTGVHIRYVEGNHDFSLGRYFQETLRAEIAGGDAAVDLDGLGFLRGGVAAGIGIGQAEARHFLSARQPRQGCVRAWPMVSVG